MKLIALIATILISTSNFSQDWNKDTLKEIKVYGIKAYQKDPVTKSDIFSERLKLNYQGNDVPTILNKTPGVTMYSDGGNNNGYMYYRIRGIDQTRINATLDGVPLNEPEDQGAYFSNYPDFVANINSIQVQRGIGISSSGTSSYGGSINFEGPNLDKKYTGIDLNYGSWNTSRISFLESTGIRNGFGSYLRISRIHSDGYRDHSGTDGGTVFYSAIKYFKKSQIKFLSFVGTSKNEMAYLPSMEDDLKINRKDNPLTRQEKDNFLQSLNILQYSNKVDSFTTFSASFFYNYLKGNYGVLISPDLDNFQLESNYYGVIYAAKFKKKNNELSIGNSITSYNRVHQMGLSPNVDSLLYKNQGKKFESTIWAKGSSVIGRFKLFTDLQLRTANFSYSRFIDYSIQVPEIDWMFFNYRVGTNYQLNKNSSLYIMYGETTKEPTRNDMFGGADDLNKDNYSEIVPFSKVKPETSDDLEIGYNYFSKKYNFKIDIFDMRFKNEIAPIGVLSYIGLPLRKNISSSYRQGIEVENLLKDNLFDRTFEFSQNLTIMRGQYKSYVNDLDNKVYNNVIPLLMPSFIYNAQALIGIKNTKLGLSFKYISSSYLDNENTLKIPELINFGSFIKYKWFTINIDNIFNRNNYNSGYVVNGKRSFFVAPTRNYSFSFNFQF